MQPEHRSLCSEQVVLKISETTEKGKRKKKKKGKVLADKGYVAKFFV